MNFVRNDDLRAFMKDGVVKFRKGDLDDLMRGDPA